MASVKVAVRIRPFNKRELAMNAKLIVQMDDKRTRIFNTKTPGSCRNIDRGKYKDFTFDYSYWSHDSDDENYASQEKVFYDLGTDVIESAFEGYNACVFAYGQTGSGKTFTMMGTPESQGLIPRICKTLFARMAAGKESGASYRTEVSFLEIHNERVKDLLRQDQSQSHSLRVREHPKKGPYVQDLSNHLVYAYSDIQECMLRGNTHRTTASTNMNDVSSRSHAIFTITFVQAGFSEGNMPSETVSKVHLVDLAGSERANATGASGQRLKEGAHINKSLVTLGSVISALAELSSSDSNGSKPSVFIPYRDSVLTWLLKDSLGGNSKTIMIAAISPADCNYGETLSTLRYTNRAKNIINKPTINEDPNVKLIRELRKEIQKLKSLIGKDVSVERPSQVLLDQIYEKQEQEKVLTEEWAEKWRETKQILQEQRALGLRKSGVGVVLDSEMPHLVGIDDDLLSTGVTLYHLKEGRTSIGTEDAPEVQDIALTGADVEAEHCVVELEGGVATLHPLSQHCWINTAQVDKPTRLSQGCIILLGRNNMFRYNDPVEAAKLRKEGSIGNGNLQSTVISLSRMSLLSWSVSDLHASSSSDNLLNSSEDLRALEEFEQQKAALVKEKEEFKKELEEREERWVAQREALEGAQRELESEWSAQWREWVEAISMLESRKRDLRTRCYLLQQRRRDEMTQVESLCREVSSLRTTLRSKQRQFREFMASHNTSQNQQQWSKTDSDLAGRDANLAESWCCNYNDEKSIRTTKELVTHHKKELTTLESELQNKVKSLDEHQAKIDEIEEELIEMAEKQKETLNLEPEFENTDEMKLILAKRTQEQLQEILRRKQSLSLNLKCALPASPGDHSSSSDDMLSSRNSKLLQSEEKNRRSRIVSAFSLLCQYDAPSSIDTNETFHTAAEDSPVSHIQFDREKEEEGEAEVELPIVESKIAVEDLQISDANPSSSSFAINQSIRLVEENGKTMPATVISSYHNCEVKSFLEESCRCFNSDKIETKASPTEENRLSPMEDNEFSEDVAVGNVLLSQRLKMLKRLNQRIARQKMLIVRCLDASTPSKEDLNKQISTLQGLQRQQIELEVSIEQEQDCWQHYKDEDVSSERLEDPVRSHRSNVDVYPNNCSSSVVAPVTRSYPHTIVSTRISPCQRYTSVYISSQNHGDRLNSPYSLTIARSLPSLFVDRDSVIDMIVSVPSYVIRGSGTFSHYEYEVRVIVRDDNWTLLRRYRKFRELYVAMKQKYGSEVAAIRFPPRQIFPRYEMIARQRRRRLEEYLRRLILVCSELPCCEALYKYNGDLRYIDKQSLLEFSSFFRRGTFESSKYGTS